MRRLQHGEQLYYVLFDNLNIFELGGLYNKVKVQSTNESLLSIIVSKSPNEYERIVSCPVTTY